MTSERGDDVEPFVARIGPLPIELPLLGLAEPPGLTNAIAGLLEERRVGRRPTGYGALEEGELGERPCGTRPQTLGRSPAGTT